MAAPVCNAAVITGDKHGTTSALFNVATNAALGAEFFTLCFFTVLAPKERTARRRSFPRAASTPYPSHCHRLGSQLSRVSREGHLGPDRAQTVSFQTTLRTAHGRREYFAGAQRSGAMKNEPRLAGCLVVTV